MWQFYGVRDSNYFYLVALSISIHGFQFMIAVSTSPVPATKHGFQAASWEGRRGAWFQSTKHFSSHSHILQQWRQENEVFSCMVMSPTKTLLPNEVGKNEYKAMSGSLHHN